MRLNVVVPMTRRMARCIFFGLDQFRGGFVVFWLVFCQVG